MHENNRRELARFLRSRRERVMPADVGLPSGSRRRAKGLRREEVAVLAGLSPSWYAYLEQGRDINPSAEVLNSLSRVLGLTDDERRYMHVLANGDAGRPLPRGSDLSADEIIRQLVLATESSPHPVYGIDRYCDIIAWNSATTSYYADFGSLPPDRRNMMRWLLEAPEARERLPDWGVEVHDIVARWRASIVGLDGDSRLDDLVAEFRALSPEFDRWWDAHEVQEHRTRTRHFQHPTLGDVRMRLIIVQSADFAPCIVVFHVPT